MYKTVGTKDEYIGKYELTKTSSNIGYIELTGIGIAEYDSSYKIREYIKGKSTQKSEPKSIYTTKISQGLGGYYLINFEPCKNSISTLLIRKSVVRKVVTIDIIANIKYKNSFVDALPAKGTQAYQAIAILKIKGKLEFAPTVGKYTNTDTGIGLYTGSFAKARRIFCCSHLTE